MLALAVALLLSPIQLTTIDQTINRFSQCQLVVYPAMGAKLGQDTLTVDPYGFLQGYNSWQADDIDEDDDEDDYV
jgi:hypothetical protein